MKHQHMTINPEVVNLFGSYPYLVDILFKQGIQSSGLIENTIRFAAWVYDPHSPLINKFPDIRERKKQALLMVGPTTEDHDSTIAILLLKYVFKSREWTLICSYENTYDELTDRVNQKIEGVNDDDIIKASERKTKLLDHMEKICFKISELKKRFYSEDEDLLDASEENEIFSPENIAAMGKR